MGRNDTKKVHVCNVCNYSTPFTTNMKNHLTRTANPCGYITEPIFKHMYDAYVDKKAKDKFVCDQCDKTFKCQNSVYRHKKKACKGRCIHVHDDVEHELNELRARLKELESNRQQMIVTGNNINSNNNNKIQNNVTINVFGQEALDHLTDEMKDAYIQRRNVGHIQLIRNIQSREENRNIKLTDRSNWYRVWDGTKFKTLVNSDVYEMLIDNSHKVLAKHYDEHEERFKHTLSENTRDQILGYLDKILDRDMDNWVWLCENVKKVIAQMNRQS